MSDIALGHLEQDLPFVSRLVRARIQAATADVVAVHGAIPGEIALLNLIGLNPGVSQKDLAQRVILKKSALTKLINELESRGLIERRKEDADARLNALHLTQDGSDRLARLRAALDPVQQDLLRPLSPAERAMLFELLWRLVDSPAT